MRISRFNAIVMADDDDIPIAAVWFRHAYDS